jgi:hypothetical protein
MVQVYMSKKWMVGDAPVSLCLLQLTGEVKHRRITGRIRDIRNSIEIIKRRRERFRLGIIQRGGDSRLLGDRSILPEPNPGCIGVLLDVIDELDKRRNLLVCRRVVENNEATPHVGAVDCLDVVLGDDAEVAGAALERFEQVDVFVGVGVDDSAGGEDDFVVYDVVAGQADACAVEGVAAFTDEMTTLASQREVEKCMRLTSKQETPNTNGPRTPTRNSHPMTLQILINRLPAGPGEDTRYLRILLVNSTIHVRQINRDTGLDVIRARPGHMATRAHGELAGCPFAAGRSQCLHDGGDIIGAGRLHDAGGFQLHVYGPVGGYAVVVGGVAWVDDFVADVAGGEGAAL